MCIYLAINYSYGQVQTGLDLPVLSDPGVHMASVPHGLGLHRDPKISLSKLAF